MRRLNYRRPNDLSKLQDELLAAVPALRPVADPDHPGRLVPVLTVSGAAEAIELTVPDDADDAAIAAVVQAHDPAPYPDAANEATLRARADAAIANLEQAWAGWGALTAAQKDATLKLTVRATIALARLVLRRLDAA